MLKDVLNFVKRTKNAKPTCMACIILEISGKVLVKPTTSISLVEVTVTTNGPATTQLHLMLKKYSSSNKVFAMVIIKVLLKDGQE